MFRTATRQICGAWGEIPAGTVMRASVEFAPVIQPSHVDLEREAASLGLNARAGERGVYEQNFLKTSINLTE